ncbi:MAG: toxin-antitoxin system YwqK family antitoxin [Gelidibacter sp.]|nr:toxin-antitoxin system YwqK family antitoxin [Gelidibacter sp.]
MKQLLTLVCCFITALSVAQSINQMDENGLRHGLWKKNFDKTNQPRYEGTFEHGKEVGTFKFYTLNKGKSVLSATKEFAPNSNLIKVKFFASTGKLISEGQMKGKLFIGKWTYYQNKTKGILTTENYNDEGLLNGERFVYYENGQIAEQTNYVNGKIEGVSKWFSENGVVIKEFNYKNGQLQGVSKYYDSEGQLLAEGNYNNDQKTGVWKYYEKGVLKEEKDFTRKSKNPKTH